MIRPAFLGLQGGETCVLLQLGDEAAHRICIARQEHVDAFLRDQARALEPGVQRALVQHVAQRGGVGQGNEQVGGDIQYRIHGEGFQREWGEGKGEGKRPRAVGKEGRVGCSHGYLSPRVAIIRQRAFSRRPGFQSPYGRA
ncbi:hypothetical protein SDC9_157848 [bioreactor metagenome]|uniref:Uncharacterized protein n=1 Tax=bioreactor metagenome TaxID=1076179 RepID=A0A645FDT6_9ZZZZ